MTRRRTLRVLLVVVSFAVVGVAAGWLWHQLWSPDVGTVVRVGDADGGSYKKWVLVTDGLYNLPALRDQFAETAWYVVVAAPAALVLGVVWSLVLDGDELLTLAAVVVGAGVAAAVMAVTGGLMGPADPLSLVEGAKVGARLPENLAVSGWSAYLLWPAGALLGLAAGFFLTATSPERSPQATAEGGPAADPWVGSRP